MSEVAGLGTRMRRLRAERQLTLKEVAAEAGVSAAHISEIERGHSSPTVSALTRIAHALGIEVGDLVDPRLAPRWRRTRPDEADPWSAPGVRVAALAAGHPDGALSVVRIELEPGARVVPFPDRDRGEDVVDVERGRVRIRAGSRRWEIGPEDILHIAVRGPLEWTCVGSSDAAAVWTLTPPRRW